MFFIFFLSFFVVTKGLAFFLTTCLFLLPVTAFNSVIDPTSAKDDENGAFPHPSCAFVLSAASAAYWIATGADSIYASKNSNI